MFFSPVSAPFECVLKANALKIWLSDKTESLREGDGVEGVDGVGDFSSAVSPSVDPLQLFLSDFPSSGLSKLEELEFRLFEASLCEATGEGGGVGSILRFRGSEGRLSSGFVNVGELLSLRLSLSHRLVRPTSDGTDGSLRLAFGLPPGEPVGLRGTCSKV